MGMTMPPPSGLTIQSLLNEEQKLFGHEEDDGFQLRVMELNLELEEEIAMNALVVSRLTWTMCALFSCVVIRMSLTFFGLETPSPDAWWDKPVAAVAGMLISLWERMKAVELFRNLSANLTTLRAEVNKAVGDLTRGR